MYHFHHFLSAQLRGIRHILTVGAAIITIHLQDFFIFPN